MQGTIGIGLGMIAAPVVVLLAPELMPGTMVVLVAILPLLTLVGERADIDWRGLGWSLPSRLVGTAGGVWLVATTDDRVLGVAVGVMVLVAVALTVRAVVVPINRGTLAAPASSGGGRHRHVDRRAAVRRALPASPATAGAHDDGGLLHHRCRARPRRSAPRR